MSTIRHIAACLLLGASAPGAGAQERGAAALGPLVQGLGVSARVLVIAAHPDDEDTPLITWLARGRAVETAYLSLTRGDGGQNLIGNELGEGLGAIRTEELLAARRLDGGRQFFTRAYDFGFSKDAAETLTQWAKDSILRDVVTVVRAFRPHVIVSVFSGTPADGHGHHQVAGLLAREAYDASGDTVRFPPAATAGHAPWTVAKFYRGAFFRFQDRATIRMNVGEYAPLLGRSYAELAAESRSQHKSQAFGALQLRGPRFDQLLREASRVNSPADARAERSIFDGVDTTWRRFAPLLRTPSATEALDSLPIALADARRSLDLFDPASVVPALARVHALVGRICEGTTCTTPRAPARSGTALPDPDLARSVEVLLARLHEALRLAAGVALEATATREVWATGEEIPVRVALYNRGRMPLRLLEVNAQSTHGASLPSARAASVTLAPDSIWRDSLRLSIAEPSGAWWLATPRRGAMFSTPIEGREEGTRAGALAVHALLQVGGVTVPVTSPVVYRYADPIRGEVARPIAGAPAVTLLLDDAVSYAPANAPIERTLRVHVRSHGATAREVDVELVLPQGLAVDSARRRVAFPAVPPAATASGPGTAFGTGGGPPPELVHTLTFRVRGRLAPGRHEVRAVATSDGGPFAEGFVGIAYDHIRTQRLFRSARTTIEAVDVRLPGPLHVGYIAGVGDNVAPALEQLGVAVTLIDPPALPRTDLSRFGAIVVGTRAYEVHEALVTHNARLLEYARGGGTLVVQYGQYEMTRPGILPYGITLGRPATRVTVEGAPVRIVDPSSPILTRPNPITAADFAGWVQDRSLYMPTTFDAAWEAPLEMSDPGEPPNRGAVLVAPLGGGTVVYTTLAFFRQLPSGVPGAARLFVNLLAARGAAPRP